MTEIVLELVREKKKNTSQKKMLAKICILFAMSHYKGTSEACSLR